MVVYFSLNHTLGDMGYTSTDPPAGEVMVHEAPRQLVQYAQAWPYRTGAGLYIIFCRSGEGFALDQAGVNDLM